MCVCVYIYINTHTKLNKLILLSGPGTNKKSPEVTSILKHASSPDESFVHSGKSFISSHNLQITEI